MIVVTGVGVISAIGNNKQEVLESVRMGHTGISSIRFLETAHRQYPVGEVKLSNEAMAQRYGLQNHAYSRTTLMSVFALDEALKQANLTKNDLPETALVSGTTVGTMDSVEHLLYQESCLDDLGDCETAINEAANYFGRWGFITTCSTACSSAANAFILGANLLRSGYYERVVVGGSECLSKYHFNGFRSLMILDDKVCRPFDATRAGLNLGEGAAYFVLETEQGAKARGAEPLAVLSGWGNACDAFHQTATSDDGEGAYKAMSQALERAGLHPGDIDYINVHGTGTPNNDASEGVALMRVFGTAVPKFSSTKSLTGHTTSASGSIEMAICLLALQNGLIPLNYNWKQPMEDGLCPVVESCLNQSLTNILCNSFGFGGNDTSLILSKYTEKQSASVRNIPQTSVYLTSVLRCDEIAAEDRPKIPPLQARRMSQILKNAIITSRVILKMVGIERPDAIITGTANGCVSETRAFIEEIVRNNEQTLSPTHFINSTHNTIGSLIAIQTKTHGYNNTYSQGRNSLKSALLDAYMQIRLGDISNALVGAYDEKGDVAVAFFLNKENDKAIAQIHDITDIDKLCGSYYH